MRLNQGTEKSGNGPEESMGRLLQLSNDVGRFAGETGFLL